MDQLQWLGIKGFKSIRDQGLEFGQLNVFIGGNGAGKSNLVEVFRFLNQVVKQRLQTYTGEAGGANAFLHFGRKCTDALSLTIQFHPHYRPPNVSNCYSLSFIPTDEDRFLFESERTLYRTGRGEGWQTDDSWSGHIEVRLAESKKDTARDIHNYLNSYQIYHFHDTSSSSAMKQTCDLNDNRILRADAGNLAAFLYMLQKTKPDHFVNIEDTIRQIAPFFGRFKLEPSALNPEKIRLEWEEKDLDTYFGAAALSDGTLRFICLATLLLQPTLPSLILIDEPELGLHPAAIQLLAGLLLSASTQTQLIVATQSVTLINQLDPGHVWVVDRRDGQSVFTHLKSADMSAWLDDYSLGELWEKNILGGRP
jgi:predicted ATPase